MASIAYKYAMFLGVFHLIAFQAQVNGYLAYQQQENPNKKAFTELSSSNITSGSEISDGGIVSGEASAIKESAGIVNSFMGVLRSPYTAIGSAEIPSFWAKLLKTITGLTESYVIYMMIRGVL